MTLEEISREGARQCTASNGRDYRNPHTRGSEEHDAFERGWSQALRRSDSRPSIRSPKERPQRPVTPRTVGMLKKSK